MNNVALQNLDLLRISYLASVSKYSLIKIESNKNVLTFTFDNFLNYEL